MPTIPTVCQRCGADTLNCAHVTTCSNRCGWSQPHDDLVGPQCPQFAPSRRVGILPLCVFALLFGAWAIGQVVAWIVR